MHQVKLIAALSALSLAPSLFSQNIPLPDKPFSIERLNDFPLIQGRSPAGAVMSPDGKWIVFGWNKTGERRLDVYVVSYPNGAPRKILDSSFVSDLPRQDDTRTKEEIEQQKTDDGGIGNFAWDPDSSQFAFGYKGRLWLMKPDGTGLHPVIDSAMGGGRPEFSPDGKYLSYSEGMNIFRYDLATKEIKQLTFLSKPQTTIDGYEWSPDSKNIVLLWDDSSKRGKGTMIDYTKDRGKAVEIPRDWVGEKSEDVKIGVLPADGGLIHFIDGVPVDSWPFAESPGNLMSWSPKSDSLAIGWFSSDFQSYSIAHYDLKSQKLAVIYTEKAPKNYETDWKPLFWNRSGSKIIFGTDEIGGKFANRSLMEMDPDGKNLAPLFAKNFDLGFAARPKDSDVVVMVTAGQTPLTTQITLLNQDGTSKVIDVLHGGQSTNLGFDSAQGPLMSDDGKEMATMASSRTINPELYSVLPAVKRLTFSQTKEFSKIDWANYSETTFPGPAGETLHGILIYRKGLDMSKPHPAVVSDIYADSGKAKWGGFIENYLAENLDMVVLCVDFSASWGYGGEFDSNYYKRMGIIDADEAVSAHSYLASLPYVNKNKIGIWGWSYGGFLTCMTMLTKPDVFAAGVAVAPVTDWTTYNDWYTRRRLGDPKTNADIFKKTSPITYASGLKNSLLLIHGIMDNNVLFENTALLVEKIIESGNYVDVMIFPKDDHSIGTDKSRPNVFGRIVRYLDSKLGS